MVDLPDDLLLAGVVLHDVLSARVGRGRGLALVQFIPRSPADPGCRHRPRPGTRPRVSLTYTCGPKSPDSHRAVWGLTSWPPVSPAGFPPASRLPAGLSPSSGVLRFVPFGRRPVPVPLRFPSGFPFPCAIFTLALPRSGSAGVGPGRHGPRSPVRPRPCVPGAAAMVSRRSASDQAAPARDAAGHQQHHPPPLSRLFA